MRARWYENSVAHERAIIIIMIIITIITFVRRVQYRKKRKIIQVTFWWSRTCARRERKKRDKKNEREFFVCVCRTQVAIISCVPIVCLPRPRATLTWPNLCARMLMILSCAIICNTRNFLLLTCIKLISWLMLLLSLRVIIIASLQVRLQTHTQVKVASTSGELLHNQSHLESANIQTHKSARHRN